MKKWSNPERSGLVRKKANSASVPPAEPEKPALQALFRCRRNAIPLDFSFRCFADTFYAALIYLNIIFHIGGFTLSYTLF
ncbi:hypothetical protein A8C56_06310 [Niabella ginsenosidivorans]|uniref:Uncharacterized protein n=1 Tax=Niabella ginsenosidivorans TaxID=1176587 RepID=A0A1A9HZY7_9BACT|nr:hypothetical protein A8C56_06310 [Niabella ginsenosidivorans]